MSQVLVAYATKRGSTAEVAEAIADTLRAEGLAVELAEAGRVDDVAGYDAVVLGGSIYMGRWHGDAKRLLARVGSVPVAVFGIGPKTLADADVAESRAQLDRALAEVPEVEPVSTAIFGGVIRPEKLRFPFNRMSPSDARDWDAIHAWAREVAAAFTREPVAG